jgi:hypothetical protein
VGDDGADLRLVSENTFQRGKKVLLENNRVIVKKKNVVTPTPRQTEIAGIPHVTEVLVKRRIHNRESARKLFRHCPPLHGSAPVFNQYHFKMLPRIVLRGKGIQYARQQIKPAIKIDYAGNADSIRRRRSGTVSTKVEGAKPEEGFQDTSSQKNKPLVCHHP